MAQSMSQLTRIFLVFIPPLHGAPHCGGGSLDASRSIHVRLGRRGPVLLQSSHSRGQRAVNEGKDCHFYRVGLAVVVGAWVSQKRTRDEE